MSYLNAYSAVQTAHAHLITIVCVVNSCQLYLFTPGASESRLTVTPVIIDAGGNCWRSGMNARAAIVARTVSRAVVEICATVFRHLSDMLSKFENKVNN